MFQLKLGCFRLVGIQTFDSPAEGTEIVIGPVTVYILAPQISFRELLVLERNTIFVETLMYRSQALVLAENFFPE